MKSEYFTIKHPVTHSPNETVCPHGILKIRACDLCDAERRNENIEEKDYGTKY